MPFTHPLAQARLSVPGRGACLDGIGCGHKPLDRTVARLFAAASVLRLGGSSVVLSCVAQGGGPSSPDVMGVTCGEDGNVFELQTR